MNKYLPGGCLDKNWHQNVYFCYTILILSRFGQGKTSSAKNKNENKKKTKNIPLGELG